MKEFLIKYSSSDVDNYVENVENSTVINIWIFWKYSLIQKIKEK